MKFEIRNKIRRIRQLRPLWGQIICRFFKALYLWISSVPFRHCIYVKIPVSCRLGNQMFMTAFGETLSKHIGDNYDVVYYTYGVDYYLQDIDPWIFSRFKILTFYIPNLQIIEEPSSFSEFFLNDIKKKINNGNVLLSGYFENIKILDLDLSRSLHKRPSIITKKITKYYGNLSDYASIHVRRGDFVQLGVSISANYYLKAMSEFPPNTRFLVISDDIPWCKCNIVSNKYIIIFADKHKLDKDSVYIDLFIPTMCCRGNVLSCSSFTWWGSALSDSKNPIRVMPMPWWTGETNKPLYFKDSIILNINK